MNEAGALPLTHLSVLRLGGPDVRNFLQGQLSCDLAQLSPTQGLLGSVNSPQGRVQAVLALIAQDSEVLIVAPAELQSLLIARLKPFILRAKVQIIETDTPFSLAARFPGDAGHLPDCVPGSVRAGASGPVLSWWGTSRLELCIGSHPISTGHQAPEDSRGATEVDRRWRKVCVAAGVPQVWRPTSGSFVAQMLNLEILGGVSFRKGCYTGQEIIARAHYRGAVKRRMFRFQSHGATPSPGERVLSAAAPVGEIVDAIAGADGTELLAVVSLTELDQALTLADGTPLERLPLPYEVPAAARQP